MCQVLKSVDYPDLSQIHNDEGYPNRRQDILKLLPSPDIKFPFFMNNTVKVMLNEISSMQIDGYEQGYDDPMCTALPIMKSWAWIQHDPMNQNRNTKQGRKKTLNKWRR